MTDKHTLVGLGQWVIDLLDATDPDNPESHYNDHARECCEAIAFDAQRAEVRIAATRITALEAEKAELVELAAALDASWLETFPDGPEADYGLVSLGDEHKALWIRFRATLAKARQTEGEG